MNPNSLTDLSEEDVQREAYLLYLASGCVPGRDLENWLAARAKLGVRQSLQRENRDSGASLTLHFPLSANVTRNPFLIGKTAGDHN